MKGEREGQHSIPVNDQWRICFVWRARHAYEVESELAIDSSPEQANPRRENKGRPKDNGLPGNA